MQGWKGTQWDWTFSEQLSCCKQGVDTLRSFLVDSNPIAEVQGWRFQRFPMSSVAYLYIE